tara:strand:- start:1239 stop:1871 length:633 start_codon:yes stop_codon:yes gene_type:complete
MRNDDVDLFNKCKEDLKKQKAVPQHGKDYYTVASRHSVLISNFVGRVSINSEIIEALCDENKVAVKVILKVDNWGSFSGLALERYDSSFINKTSALENAETSALGRALASFGLHGSEFASADELINAKNNQNKKTIVEDQKKEKIDDIYIATKLEVIENNKDKKNSTALRSDLENLKTRIYKANKWDSFVKSNLYTKYFTLQNKNKPKRS